MTQTAELIAKLEACDGPDAGVFREVFHGIRAQIVLQADRQKWMNLKVWFEATLDCQAWESAAIMLKPEGWGYCIEQAQSGSAFLWELSSDNTPITGNANHPAIALLICILKAKEEQQ